MDASRTNGFFLSAMLHGGAVAVILLGAYLLQDEVKQAPKVFELVAGEGDNYAATEAPLLGVPGGQKVTMPEPPAPEPPAHEISPIQTAPAEPMPTPPTPEPVIQRALEPKPAPAQTKPAPDTIPDFKKSVTRISKKRETRIVNQYKKEQAGAERKAKEEELKSKRITKEEFDRMNRQMATRGGSGVKHIDTEGIRNGVIGGSSANKVGGAGGKALSREEGDAVDAYVAMLAARIKESLDEKPGVGAGLVVEVEIRILPSGAITGIRVTKSSGSPDFDQAARDALGSIHMPERPKGLSEVQRFPIRGTE